MREELGDVEDFVGVQLLRDGVGFNTVVLRGLCGGLWRRRATVLMRIVVGEGRKLLLVMMLPLIRPLIGAGLPRQPHKLLG